MLTFNLKLLIIMIVLRLNEVNNTQSHGVPQLEEYFCKNNRRIVSTSHLGFNNGYKVIINKKLNSTTEIKVKLDSGGTISFVSKARFTGDKDLINNIFNFILLEDSSNFTFIVNGKLRPHHPPYVISLKINGKENCFNPNRSYFEKYHLGTEPFWSKAPDKFCGRRRINTKYTELLVSGSASKSGEWPWHVAIYQLKKGTLEYICGGTLISKFTVLTAAHCATFKGDAMNPEILGIILGKYSLLGNELTTQDKEVHQVIVHDEYEHQTLNNDIALLKLRTEAAFNNYVQPACLWLDKAYDQMESYSIFGTVVGWGIDQSDNLSKKLQEATMPSVPEIDCIRYNPVFYSNILNGKKFCAGYNNGTSACNGDSGGGFHVFVRDAKTPASQYLTTEIPGAWYVKGIVSVSLARQDDSICDPQAYAVFTDVAKYRDWILSNM
ncbi:CLIP domain-containing serine protease HP8-like [Nymphalis io]|uniref:CLIP domain-containing serine protease HP8-like n=1 Tax=Inachis io TaxID=171585 RepID=UPI0021682252|nr:CLIP domain-containing serine protease HP8-like [Nymphalis io]